MGKNIELTLAVAALLAGQSQIMAGDWPQYRGPNTGGISTESVSLKWSSEGPKVVWKTPTKNGFSSFAVAEDQAFTQMNRDLNGENREVVVALDASNGKEQWSFDIGAGKYVSGGDSGTPNNKGGDGPRSTPSISDGKVYVLNQDIVLFCLNAKDGKLLWKKDILKEFAGGKNISWNSAASPVIDGDLVFAGGGGQGQSLLAFNKNSGAVVWKGFTEKITHATPVVATIHGVRQVIFFLQSGLLSVSAKEGKELWRFAFPYKVSTAASPVVCGDIVYCSAGYTVGGGACQVSKNGNAFAVKELYKVPGDTKIANHWSTPVYKDGHLYGMFSFKAYGNGPMKCVEAATGKIKWEKPGFGAGQVILVNDKVVGLTDDGQVIVVEATPEAFKEVSRFQAVTGKCWSTPALANGHLYVRSTKEGACLDITQKVARP